MTEAVAERVIAVPWFKHYRPQIIDEYVLGFRKVCENAAALL